MIKNKDEYISIQNNIYANPEKTETIKMNE